MIHPTAQKFFAEYFVFLQMFFYYDFLHREFEYWQLFCKGTCFVGVNSLFFGMYSSVPSALNSLFSADFPAKFCKLCLLLGSAIPENTRILYGIVSVYFLQKELSKEKMKCSYKNQRLL